MQTVLSLVFVALLSLVLAFDDFKVSYEHTHGLKLRYGVKNAVGTPVADLLYVHGFADRADNHMLWFRELAKQGIRVIAFDLPQHGENSGIGNKIDFFSFQRLSELVGLVEKKTREDHSRPLLLAGWSTGGLLVVRMLQDSSMRKSLGRAVKGTILFAPGVSVHPLVGVAGFVTPGTLTSNPNPLHGGPISPKSPLLTPAFAAFLVTNSLCSRNENLLPEAAKAPLLVYMGGASEDKYVVTDDVKDWVVKQSVRKYNINAIQCRHAKHELDNEIEPIGEHVRTSAARFAKWAVTEGQSEPAAKWKHGIPKESRCDFIELAN